LSCRSSPFSSEVQLKISCCVQWRDGNGIELTLFVFEAALPDCVKGGALMVAGDVLMIDCEKGAAE